jgi:hypothetical protein
MAMPTLIGFDGRRAIPAFTCVESMRAWQANARPLPVPASRVWEAAVADACAVVIDVAGPVPLAVEGARLTSLASGEAADRVAARLTCTRVDGPPASRHGSCCAGGAEHDLVIALTLSGERAGQDVPNLAPLSGTPLWNDSAGDFAAALPSGSAA